MDGKSQRHDYLQSPNLQRGNMVGVIGCIGMKCITPTLLSKWISRKSSICGVDANPNAGFDLGTWVSSSAGAVSSVWNVDQACCRLK